MMGGRKRRGGLGSWSYQPRAGPRALSAWVMTRMRKPTESPGLGLWEPLERNAECERVHQLACTVLLAASDDATCVRVTYHITSLRLRLRLRLQYWKKGMSHARRRKR